MCERCLIQDAFTNAVAAVAGLAWLMTPEEIIHCGERAAEMHPEAVADGDAAFERSLRMTMFICDLVTMWHENAREKAAPPEGDNVVQFVPRD